MGPPSRPASQLQQGCRVAQLQEAQHVSEDNGAAKTHTLIPERVTALGYTKSELGCRGN